MGFASLYPSYELLRRLKTWMGGSSPAMTTAAASKNCENRAKPVCSVGQNRGMMTSSLCL